MNDNDDYLLISGEKDGETKQIFSSDICYIEAAQHYSFLYLNNDKQLILKIDFGELEKLIEKWFQFNHKYFYRIGKSLIINRKYLDAFYVSKGKIILADNRSEYLEGYRAGYNAGYDDRDKNKYLVKPSSQRPAVTELHASVDSLKDFKKKIEEKVKLSKKKDNN